MDLKAKAKRRRVETTSVSAAAAANEEKDDDEEGEGDDGDDQQHEVTTKMQKWIETTLFFIGLYPYKLILQMPQTSEVTLSVVKAAATRRSIALLAILQSSSILRHPRGHFVVRHDHVNSRQYGFFKHTNTTGCSLVSSRFHGRFLPVPLLRHKDSLARPTTLKIRAGSKFLYNQDFSYDFDAEGQGRMKIDTVGATTSRRDQVEDQRKVELIINLRATLGEDYEVTTVHDSSQYCPFTGGGDIWVYKRTHDELVILDEDGRDSEDEAPASIENKVVTGVSDTQKERVTKQLQANMVLTATHFLQRRLEKCPADAKSIESVTTYGMQLGIICPVKILKLTLNFRTGTSLFEELFSKEHCPYSHMFIDMALASLVSSCM